MKTTQTKTKITHGQQSMRILLLRVCILITVLTIKAGRHIRTNSSVKLKNKTFI